MNPLLQERLERPFLGQGRLTRPTSGSLVRSSIERFQRFVACGLQCFWDIPLQASRWLVYRASSIEVCHHFSTAFGKKGAFHLGWYLESLVLPVGPLEGQEIACRYPPCTCSRNQEAMPLDAASSSTLSFSHRKDHFHFGDIPVKVGVLQ